MHRHRLDVVEGFRRTPPEVPWLVVSEQVPPAPQIFAPHSLSAR